MARPCIFPQTLDFFLSFTNGGKCILDFLLADFFIRISKSTGRLGFSSGFLFVLNLFHNSEKISNIKFKIKNKVKHLLKHIQK
jgi:hypothetical protein